MVPSTDDNINDLKTKRELIDERLNLDNLYENSIRKSLVLSANLLECQRMENQSKDEDIIKKKLSDTYENLDRNNPLAIAKIYQPHREIVKSFQKDLLRVSPPHIPKAKLFRS